MGKTELSQQIVAAWESAPDKERQEILAGLEHAVESIKVISVSIHGPHVELPQQFFLQHPTLN